MLAAQSYASAIVEIHLHRDPGNMDNRYIYPQLDWVRLSGFREGGCASQAFTSTGAAKLARPGDPLDS